MLCRSLLIANVPGYTQKTFFLLNILFHHGFCQDTEYSLLHCVSRAWFTRSVCNSLCLLVPPFSTSPSTSLSLLTATVLLYVCELASAL